MTNASENNKRIAKNTVLLYFRTLFIMLVSLYTSRIVLNALGETDYGIYNVVGGVVTMFSVLSGSLSAAISRFITFELGIGNIERLKRIFSTSVNIQIFMAFIILALCEIIGIWFLNEKMSIPDERMAAANFVLQCSIITFMVNLVSVPYNATIIAHERMNVFAYIGILEACMKLLVAYLINISTHDKLFVYATLILTISILLRVIYGIYCEKHFTEAKYRFILDKPLLKEMTDFAGWNMFGNLAGVLFGQGLNMLLNVFFGPAINAARAIAVQVQNAIQQFVTNFQMALNPQITKTYAQGDFFNMHKLMYRSARFSFYLLFLLSLPVLFETEFILEVWLKNVPESTIVFLRIMICISLIYTLSNPLTIANQATGKVKRYQAICGSILLLILPVSYIFLRLGYPAYTVFIVHFAIESLTQIVRMILLRPLIGIRIIDYIKHIYSQVTIVTLSSIILPVLIYINIKEDSLQKFFIMVSTCLISVTFSTYFLGLSKKERLFFLEKTKERIGKFK